MRAAQAKYAKTEKYKAARKRYNASEKGRAKNTADSNRWRNDPKNRDKLRACYKKSDLKRHYGMTPETWGAMFERQGFACAACGSPDPGRKNGQWSTDHDHARDDKHARAILCNGCNLALGHIKDNIPRLQALVGYLEKINGAAEA
jgi:hypothetical protein